MNKSDINGHRSRSRCVYYELAEEYIASQLHPIDYGISGGENISATDVLTLIEMRDEPETVFECQPISWVLFNTMVHLREKNGAKSHGNYFPAIEKAFESIASTSSHSQCSNSIFFLSDGKPSDTSTIFKYLSPEIFQNYLLGELFTKCRLFGDRLTFTTIGFGDKQGEFELLKQMASRAVLAGSVGTFQLSGADSSGLKRAISSLISSTTTTRTQLSRLSFKKDEVRVPTTAQKEMYDPTKAFDNTNWHFFNTSSGDTAIRFELEFLQDGRTGYTKKEFIKKPFLHPEATGVAVRRKYFGEGAERIVYEMFEVDRDNIRVGVDLVAKESKFIIEKKSNEKDKNNNALRQDFHQNFVKTQRKALTLARKFNEQLNRLQVSKEIPRITFLDTSVYMLQNDESALEILCEKRLNVSQYRKWNDNAGNIDGIKRNNPAYVPEPLVSRYVAATTAPVHSTSLGALGEEEEEEESDEDDEDNENDDEEEGAVATKMLIGGGGGGGEVGKSAIVARLEQEILDDDIPQAFTHFTHRYTKRKHMVCDLQGVIGMVDGSPTYELTDPCIHTWYGSGGRSDKYGRTNKGQKGMGQFFQTHHCNALCEILGQKVN